MSNLRKAEIRGMKIGLFLFLLLGILLLGLPAQEEDEEEVKFKGTGIQVRLGGGYTLLSGGDFDTGIQGMYDQEGDSIVGAGFTLTQSDLNALRSGYEFGGDIVYYFAGRLGIGAGGSLTKVNKTSEHRYKLGSIPHDYSMTVVPQINIFTLRLGVFYEVPINRLLTVCFNAGPAYYMVDYKLSLNRQGEAYSKSLTQKAETSKLGVQGGIGLEIRMNARMMFLLEVQGRYAKISGFEGREQLYEYIGGPVVSTDKTGVLYYLEEEGYSRLEISPEDSGAVFNVRKAVFDFSGVSFRAGLNFMF